MSLSEAVAVVDFGSGNLGSLVSCLRSEGIQSEVVADPELLVRFGRVILPGVGHFGAAMNTLVARGLDEAIRFVVADGAFLLGICLGMQLLCVDSEETSGADTEAGLGLINAKVVSLEQLGCVGRIPHVGWNSVHQTSPGGLLGSLPAGADFYFVHSYAVDLASIAREDVVATTCHSVPFASVIRHGNVVGTQFHPEKSSRFGRLLLQDLIRGGA